MHYALVFLLIAVALIALGPVSVALALSNEVLLFLLLAGLVSFAAESWIAS